MLCPELRRLRKCRISCCWQEWRRQVCLPEDVLRGMRHRCLRRRKGFEEERREGLRKEGSGGLAGVQLTQGAGVLQNCGAQFSRGAWLESVHGGSHPHHCGPGPLSRYPSPSRACWHRCSRRACPFAPPPAALPLRAPPLLPLGPQQPLLCHTHLVPGLQPAACTHPRNDSLLVLILLTCVPGSGR